MAGSTLSNTIAFFDRFGFFDIILPFLLVFTITFGILEKTQVFGSDKKNINSMVAFVIGLFVVGAVQIVEAIRDSLPSLAFFMIIVMSFLMMYGFFIGSEGVKFESAWQKGVAFVVVFLVIIAIFLNSLGWLDSILNYATRNWNQTVVPTLIFFVIIIAGIFYVVKGSSGSSK